MVTLMYCPNCNKWVVFGNADRDRYNEAAYIIGGVTVTRNCPNCRKPLADRKQ